MKDAYSCCSSTWCIHATTTTIDARLAVAHLEHVKASESFPPAIAASELAACSQVATLFLAKLVSETSASFVWTIDARSTAIARESTHDVQLERFTKQAHQDQEQRPSHDLVSSASFRIPMPTVPTRTVRDWIRLHARTASSTWSAFRFQKCTCFRRREGFVSSFLSANACARATCPHAFHIVGHETSSRPCDVSSSRVTSLE